MTLNHIIGSHIAKSRDSIVKPIDILEPISKEVQELLESQENLALYFLMGNCFFKANTNAEIQELQEKEAFSLCEVISALCQSDSAESRDLLSQISAQFISEEGPYQNRKSLIENHIDDNIDFLLHAQDYKDVMALLYLFNFESITNTSPEVLFQEIFAGDFSTIISFITEKTKLFLSQDNNTPRGAEEFQDILKIISRICIKIPSTTQNRIGLTQLLDILDINMQLILQADYDAGIKKQILCELAKLGKNFSHLPVYENIGIKNDIEEKVIQNQESLEKYNRIFKEILEDKDFDFPHKQRELDALGGTQIYHSALMTLEKYRYFAKEDIHINPRDEQEEMQAFDDIFSYYSLQFESRDHLFDSGNAIISDFTKQLMSGKNVFPLIGMIFDIIRYINIDQNIILALGVALGRCENVQKIFDYPYIIAAMYNVLEESSEIAQKMKSERQRVYIDGLTKIQNRYSYDAESRKIEAKINRTQHSDYYLLVIDIDNFKVCNDSFGHAIGDIILKHIAQTLAQSTRVGSDQVFRYGGEEFCVLVECDNKQGAESLIHKLVSEIEKTVCEYKETVYPVTISIGGAKIGVGDDIKEVFKRADRVLYQAKEAGKNQGILYTQ